MLEITSSGGNCYTSTRNRKTVVMLILRHCHFMFFDADFVRHLDEIQKAHTAFEQDDNEVNVVKFQKIFDRIKSDVLDAVKVFLCFENYLKAELLLQGYVIHKFDRSFCSANSLNWLKIQDKEPIPILEMKKAEHLSIEEAPKDGFFHSLQDKTISYPTMKNFEYKKVLAHLPDVNTLLDIVDSVQDERNTLHFLASQGKSLSQKKIEHHIFLRNYVKDYVMARHNQILMEIGKEDGMSDEVIKLNIQYLFSGNYA